MDIELWYFSECPNWQRAKADVEQVAAGLGIEVSVTTRAIETQDRAIELGFTGSPTLVINGEDPFADPSAPVGLACRIYRTEDGLAGSPSLRQLENALTDRVS